MTTARQAYLSSTSEDASISTAFLATNSFPASICATSVILNDIFTTAEKFNNSNNLLIQWLRDGCLIPTSKKCIRCDNMSLKNVTSTSDGDIFFCKSCAKAVRVRNGSFFSRN